MLVDLFRHRDVTHLELANESFLHALRQATISRDTTNSNVDTANSTERKPRTIFNLFHTFANALPALVKKYKHESEKVRIAHIRRDLVELLTYQLDAFLAEILLTPLSTSVMDIKLSKDRMVVRDPRYAHGDVLDQIGYAVEAADANGFIAHRDRYMLELEQWRALIPILKDAMPHAVLEAIQQIEPDNTKELPAGWTKNDSALPSDLCTRYNISPNTHAYLGPKRFTVYPQNVNVYQEGMAYWCMYSVVYIPSLPDGEQFHLVLNQFFNKFDYADHSKALLAVDESKEPLNIPENPTEAEVMQCIALPGTEFSTLNPSLIMAELTKKIGKQSKVHEIMVEQQRAVAEFQRRSQYIKPSSEYLSQVFLEEFNRYARGQSSYDEIYGVLKYMGEAVLNPLLLGDLFDKKLALNRYYTMFNPHTRKFSSDTVERAQQLEAQRNSFISSFENTSMFGLLNRAVSILDCSKGEFGGLTNPTQLANIMSNPDFIGRFANTSEMVSFFHSPDVTRADLFAAIGERAQNFHPGVCGADLRAKGFHVGCGNHTLIGECGLCYGCEIGGNFPKMDFNRNTSDKTSADDAHKSSGSDIDGTSSAHKNYLTIDDAVFVGTIARNYGPYLSQ